MAIPIEDLEKIYNENVKKLYKFFYYKTLNKQVAEDLTSETFLRFGDSLNKQQVENQVGFLYGIAKNIFTDYLKSKYKNEVHIDDNLLDFYHYANDFVSNTSKHNKLIDLLLELLPQLPKKQKEILELRLVEKYSIKEICKKLSKPDSYVKTTQNRAIKSIKKLLELYKLT